jgi:hypothetical protein
MSQKTLLLLLLCLTFGAKAQQLHLTIDSLTKKYTYEETIRCDSTLSDTSLFYSIKDWALSQGLKFNRLKDDKLMDKAMMSAFMGVRYANFTPVDLQYKNKNVIKSEQPESKKLILNGVYKYTGNLLTCLQTSYTNFDVIIKTRQGRAKIIFTNFTIDMYVTATAAPSELNGITLEDFIKNKLADYGKPCRETVSTYTIELQNQCDIILKDFKAYVSNLHTNVKDDW